MERRRLGRTEIDVSVLSIGGLYTSSLAGGDDATARIVRRAVELGVNAIDTAPAYADSEATVGRAIAGLDAPLVLTTKLGGRPQPFDARDVRGLRRSVEESLQLLGRETIDVLMIHEPDRPRQYPWWTTYAPLDGPVLELIDELKTAGTIRFAGLAGTTVTELAALVEDGRFDVVLTAFNYNALFREASGTVIPAATDRDMGVVVGSALGQGFLTKRADAELAEKPVWLSEVRRRQFLAYYRLLDEAGLGPAELCLRFLVGDRRVSTIPIGCKTVEHLDAAVAAVEKGPLPDDVHRRLDEIALMIPRRPFEEPMILPLGKNYFGPGIANVGTAAPVGMLNREDN